MVLIIGVGHTVQCDKKHFWPETVGFVRELESLALDRHIRLITEEFSIEALFENKISSTTTRDVADKLNIPHKYCDPVSKERKIIGWYSKSDDLKRLKYWFDKIKNNLDEPTIFVCGTNHSLDFANLIQENGFEACVLDKAFITKRDGLF